MRDSSCALLHVLLCCRSHTAKRCANYVAACPVRSTSQQVKHTLCLVFAQRHCQILPHAFVCLFSCPERSLRPLTRVPVTIPVPANLLQLPPYHLLSSSSTLAVLQANATKASNTTTTAAAKGANATAVAAKSADLPAESPAPATSPEPKKNSAVSMAAASCVSVVMAAAALVLAVL